MEATLAPHSEIIDRIMSGEKHLSFSSLNAFKSSPKTFIDYQRGVKEETDAMIYGSMVHCLVLQPHLFEERYHCIDDRDICVQIGGAKPRATYRYKEWFAVAQQEAGERILVETDDYIAAKIIAREIKTNKASAKVLGLCPDREKPIEWEYMNFKFKGFKDADGEKDVFDLKTCADASPDKFHRDIISKGYYLQAAMYLYAEGVKNYFIVAVDKKGGISVHHLHPKLIEHGMDEYHKLLTSFNECVLKDAWDQNYDFWAERWDGIFTAEKPAWLY